MGAVIERDRRIISTGYNGAPPNQPHCTEVGCSPGVDGGCTRTIHAEVNAIAFAARHGVSVHGARMWCTHSPCRICAMVIASAGIDTVFYNEKYRIEDGIFLLEDMGVQAIEYN